MSIQSEIDRITDAKNASLYAVGEKGVDIAGSERISDLPELISQIHTLQIIVAPEFPTENIIKDAVYVIYEASENVNNLDISTLDDLILSGCSYSKWIYANNEWVKFIPDKLSDFKQNVSDAGKYLAVGPNGNIGLVDAPEGGETVTDEHINGLIDTKTTNLVTLDTEQTLTAKKTIPQIETGTGATSYFQSQRFRGEGIAATYYHAVDFGFSGHNQVDFYEYGGIWNFWKNTTATATTDTANQCLKIELDGVSNRGRKFAFPTKAGTFALISDIPAVPSTDDINDLIDAKNKIFEVYDPNTGMSAYTPSELMQLTDKGCILTFGGAPATPLVSDNSKASYIVSPNFLYTVDSNKNMSFSEYNIGLSEDDVNGLIDNKTSNFLTLDTLPKYDGGVR